MPPQPDFSPDRRPLVLLSNREPYEHVRADRGIDLRTPAGGLVSALDPTMRRMHGTWVAWGSGSADRETADETGRLIVPPDDPQYTLRRVWLDAADVEGYYLGFANSVLWPLCHLLVQHLEFRTEDWERYVAVNERFAAAVMDEVQCASAPRGDSTSLRPIVWIQDYHFALVADRLRRERSDLFIHQFWHIPFPPPDILRLLPTTVQQMLLRGMLGNDLLEFHTERHVQNFFDCVAAFVPGVEMRREHRRLYFEGRTVHAGAFPISIDVERYEALARGAEGAARTASLRRQYAGGERQLGVSVDRVDYTKGIPERLRALDRLWAEHPEFVGRFTFILVATPSRSDLAPYRRLEEEIAELVDDINQRFGQDDWLPIVLVSENVDADRLASLYRAADLCLVSSLQDGMNLVAKEFVACQVDECGVLVLSRFAGAAEEFDGDAVLINPFNLDSVVHGIRDALVMPASERAARMHDMRELLHRSSIFDWLDAIGARVRELLSNATPSTNGRGTPLVDDLPADRAMPRSVAPVATKSTPAIDEALTDGRLR